eukprot:923514-Rhodomonas_salina.1
MPEAGYGTMVPKPYLPVPKWASGPPPPGFAATEGVGPEAYLPVPTWASGPPPPGIAPPAST